VTTAPSTLDSSMDSDFRETLEEFPRPFESERLPFNSEYRDALVMCEDFRDVFALVKRIVKDHLGLERPNMVLQLVDLPLHIGAAHPVGTNRIVMNKRLLDLAVRHRTFSEVRAIVFSILLHEYIHSLGYLNEYETRRLVFSVSHSAFGSDHLATKVARYGPWYIFRTPAAS